jgi:hypothetical protein
VRQVLVNRKIRGQNGNQKYSPPNPEQSAKYADAYTNPGILPTFFHVAPSNFFRRLSAIILIAEQTFWQIGIHYYSPYFNCPPAQEKPSQAEKDKHGLFVPNAEINKKGESP